MGGRRRATSYHASLVWWCAGQRVCQPCRLAGSSEDYSLVALSEPFGGGVWGGRGLGPLNDGAQFKTHGHLAVLVGSPLASSVGVPHYHGVYLGRRAKT
jgi:hypothetical protein